MSKHMKNIGVVLGDSKNRVILLIVLVVVVLSITLGIHGLKKESDAMPASAKVNGVPAVEAIPGVGEASREYIKLQREQNLLQAKQAAKTGTSAVPTIIRSSYLGSSSGFDQTPVDLSTSGVDTDNACQPEKLRLAKKAGVSAFELRCRGCSASALRSAGYTAGELHEAGFSAEQLKAAGFTAAELKTAGFSAAQLKAAGFSAQDLVNAGFSPAILKEAGFNALELSNAGVSDAVLKSIGFTDEQIKAAHAGGRCAVHLLKKAKMAGVKAAQLKAQGCGPEALKAAGYTAQELKEAGFTAEALRAAGFDAKALRAAGFTAAQLKEAGFSEASLKAAGFSESELASAGYSAAEIAGQCHPDRLKLANMQGISASTLREAGCGLSALKAAGFTAEALKAAGFTDEDLLKAGLAKNDLKKACHVEALKKARDQGVSAQDLRARGCSPSAMKAAGYTAGELKDAGFSAHELREAGFSASALKAAGFTAEALKAAGFSANDLKAAGFTAEALKAAGFSAGELKAAGFSASALKAAGFSAKALRGAGFSAEALSQAGFDAQALKSAGFSEGELVRAGVQTEFSGANRATPPQSDFIAEAEKQALNGEDQASAALDRLRQRQAEQISAQERRQMVDMFEQGMSAQAGDLIGSWTHPSVQQVVEGAPPEQEKQASGLENHPQTVDFALAEKLNLRAGDVFFAVLDTGINSDEQSPVLATIIQGPLKGTKLLGAFQRSKEKVILSFTTMNVPWLSRSVPMSAVAIDQNTARTALADRVDQHYLLRYGTLFASSFLSGLSEAITQSGSETISIGDDTGIAIGEKTDTELGLMALGKVGDKYASALGENFKVNPTIHVAAGKGIGILVMQDIEFNGMTKKTDASEKPASDNFWETNK